MPASWTHHKKALLARAPASMSTAQSGGGYQTRATAVFDAFSSSRTLFHCRLSQVAAMKEAGKGLKAEVKKMNLSEIEDLTDDMADLMEDMNEINEIMGRSYK